jgi:hypothetical protein
MASTALPMLAGKSARMDSCVFENNILVVGMMLSTAKRALLAEIFKIRLGEDVIRYRGQ